MRDSSPPVEDADPYGAESEAPTEVDTDDFVLVGAKRTPQATVILGELSFNIILGHILTIPFI